MLQKFQDVIFPPESTRLTLYIANALLSITLLGGYSLYRARHNKRLQKAFGLAGPKLRWSVLASASLWGASLFYAVVQLVRLTPLSPNTGMAIFRALDLTEWTIVPLLLLILVDVSSEELFFRGMGYTYFKARVPPLWAAGCSALLFALAHLNLFPTLFIACILLGLANVYLLEKTKSLLAPCILHASFNVLVIFAFNPQSRPILLHDVPFRLLVLTGLSVLCWRFVFQPLQTRYRPS